MDGWLSGCKGEDGKPTRSDFYFIADGKQGRAVWGKRKSESKRPPARPRNQTPDQTR